MISYMVKMSYRSIQVFRDPRRFLSKMMVKWSPSGKGFEAFQQPKNDLAGFGYEANLTEDADEARTHGSFETILPSRILNRCAVINSHTWQGRPF